MSSFFIRSLCGGALGDPSAPATQIQISLWLTFPWLHSLGKRLTVDCSLCTRKTRLSTLWKQHISCANVCFLLVFMWIAVFLCVGPSEEEFTVQTKQDSSTGTPRKRPVSSRNHIIRVKLKSQQTSADTSDGWKRSHTEQMQYGEKLLVKSSEWNTRGSCDVCVVTWLYGCEQHEQECKLFRKEDSKDICICSTPIKCY